MQNKSFFVQTFLLIIIFLVLPVVAFLLLFNSLTLRTIENEIFESNYSKMDVIESHVKNITSLSDEIYYDIYTNPCFKMMQTNPFDEETALQMKNLLSTTTQHKSSIASIFYYDKKNDVIISSNNDPLNPKDVKNERWISSDGSLHIDNGVFQYLYSSPNDEILVSINIPESAMQGNSFSSNDEYRYIFITDSNNIIASHTRKYLIGSALSADIITAFAGKSKGNIVLDDYYGERCLITFQRSKHLNVSYYAVNNFDSTVKDITLLKNSIYLYSVILMLAMMGGAYYISRKMYSPIKKVMDKISNNSTLFGKTKNEFAAISNAMEEITKKENDVVEFFNQSKLSIKHNYIHQIMFGGIKEKHEYQMVGMPFDDLLFTSMIVYHKTSPDNYYFKMLIINLFEQRLNNTYKCYGAPGENDTIYFIINLNSESQLEELEDVIEEIQKELNSMAYDRIIITIGTIASSLAGLQESFSAASKAFGNRIFLEKGSIIPAWQFSHTEKSDYNPKKEMLRLIKAAQISSLDDVKKEASSFFRSFSSKPDISADNIKKIYTELYAEINSLCTTHALEKSAYLEYGFDLEALTAEVTVKEINEVFLNILCKINGLLTRQSVSDKEYAEKISLFMRRNYKQDIEVSKLAADLGISYSHLRRVFRDNMNTSLISYINELRITDARALLVETEQTISEIALSLGYNNEQSFNRFFKKIVGISPGKYRLKNR